MAPSHKHYTLWFCQKICKARSFLLEFIFIRFDTKSYQQITNGYKLPTPRIADLFLFSYKIHFMLSRSHENQANIMEALNSTSTYLDDLLNIDNDYLNKRFIKSIQNNSVKYN